MFHLFHLKLHGVKVVILCLSLAKVTATSNSSKGTTTWLLLSSHSAKVSANLIYHSHIISIVVAQKAKNLPTVKLVTFMACQVYQITTRTQAILDPSMVAAADITPAVPNLCSYKNQFPDHRLCLQQPRFSCKHIKI